jgi:hypothetical protein
MTVKGHSYIPAFMILEIMPVLSCLIFLLAGALSFSRTGTIRLRCCGTDAGLALPYSAAGRAGANSTGMGNERS